MVWKEILEMMCGAEDPRPKGKRCAMLHAAFLFTPRPSGAAFFNLAPKHPFLVRRARIWLGSRPTFVWAFAEGVLTRIVDIVRRLLVLWFTVGFNPIGSWSIQNYV